MPRKSTIVYAVVDDSGSMYCGHLMDVLPAHLTKLQATLRAQGIPVVFHVFSHVAKSGEDLGLLTGMSAGTNIAAGFRNMVEWERRHEVYEQAVVLFVSDGQDTTGSRHFSKLPQLQAATSVLLTIAVGRHFPSALVVDDLLPLYHTTKEEGMPLVLQLCPEGDYELMVSGCEDVLQEAELLIVNLAVKGGAMEGGMAWEDCRGSTEAMLAWARRRYNICSLECIRRRMEPVACVGLLDTTKGEIRQVICEVEAMVGGQMKPTTSNLLRARPLTQLIDMITQLNLLKGMAQQDALRRLSDEEMQETLGFANTINKYSCKACRFFPLLFLIFLLEVQMHDFVGQRYFEVDMEETCACTMKYLRKYVETDGDRALEDSLHFLTQAEYLMDAQRHLKEIKANIRTLPGIIDFVALLGLVVKMHPMPQGIQMNLWLYSIKSLSTLLSIVTTYDFYRSFHGHVMLREHQEVGNCLILLGGAKEAHCLYSHVQTYLLTGNWLLNHPKSARLAASAALVVHLLGHEEQKPWMLPLYEHARGIFAAFPLECFHGVQAYLEALRGPQFRMCLISESPDKGMWMHKCEGLSKFIWGVWILMHTEGPMTFSGSKLHAMHKALVCEFVARLEQVQLKDFFTLELQMPQESMALPTGVQTKYLTMREIIQEVSNVVAKDLKEVFQFTPEPLLTNVRLYHLSLEQIRHTFRHLGAGDGRLERGELLQCVVRAFEGSLDRHFPKHEMEEEVLMKSVYYQCFQGRVKALRDEVIKESAKAMHKTYFERKHCGMPWALPKDYMQKYKVSLLPQSAVGGMGEVHL